MRMEPVKIRNISRKYHYTIYDRNRQIGEITYKIHGKYVIVGNLFISHEYRNLGYGYLVVEYLMKKYKTKYNLQLVLFFHLNSTLKYFLNLY